ncbi:MAG: hypothetical protein J6B11_07780 [Spirochaetales bacterium]|nr:hypothetical protein [Spirochaetales bacterium]
MARKYKTKEEVLLRDVKTNEIKTYKEWAESTIVGKNEKFTDSRDKIEFSIMLEKLIPIYD